MGKGHADNVRARKKRGEPAFKKKHKRRQKAASARRAHRLATWNVLFSCGAELILPSTALSDLQRVAKARHICSFSGCHFVRYEEC